jgi:hypothetical protein
LKERRGQRRQRAQIVAGVEAAPGCDTKQLAELAREGTRAHGFALDDPGIAVRGLAARLAAVDEEDAAATALQVDGDAHTDDPGTEYDRISQTSLAPVRIA